MNLKELRLLLFLNLYKVRNSFFIWHSELLKVINSSISTPFKTATTITVFLFRVKFMKLQRLCDILNGFAGKRIIVIGDFILDNYLWGNTKRISPEAPVPVVGVESETYRLGGAGNVAHNLRTLGANVLAIGVVGDDRNADYLKEALETQCIDTSGVIVDVERPTTTKIRVMGHTQYLQQQQMLRIDREKILPVEGHLLDCLVKTILKVDSPDAIFISDYAKGVVTDPLMDVVRQVKIERQIPIVVDPKGRNFDKYRSVTAISPNQTEALGALNLSKADEATVIDTGHRLVNQYDVGQIYMTRSEKGVALFDANGNVTQIPAFAREVFDVSGAGDSTAAVYLLSLLAEATPIEAAYIGNLAGGIVVGKVGVVAVTIDEILNYCVVSL
jgi:rfaE bifunctional protein kinase chain/domain